MELVSPTSGVCVDYGVNFLEIVGSNLDGY